MEKSCSLKMDGGSVTFSSNGMSLVEAWGYMNRIFIQDAIKTVKTVEPEKKVDTLVSPQEEEPDK